MEKKSLEQRVQVLEDKEAIKDVTYQYALYINQGWNNMKINPEAFSEVFTKDAVWESTFMSIREEGLDNIIKSFIKETKTVLFAMHTYSNPIIQIEENSASGNWLFWVVSKMEAYKINQVFMSQDIQYTKTANGWRIKEVKLHFGDILKHKIKY